MAGDISAYQVAVNRLVSDRESLAYRAVLDMLRARKAEVEGLWAKEQLQPFEPERLRALNRANMELVKMLTDIEKATQAFIEQPKEEAHGPTA